MGVAIPGAAAGRVGRVAHGASRCWLWRWDFMARAPAIFVHRRWMKSAQVHACSAHLTIRNFTGKSQRRPQRHSGRSPCCPHRHPQASIDHPSVPGLASPTRSPRATGRTSLLGKGGERPVAERAAARHVASCPGTPARPQNPGQTWPCRKTRSCSGTPAIPQARPCGSAAQCRDCRYRLSR
jgi:hypothetical protein